ncbi:MAG: hypothetical protein DI546_20575 [Rhizobium sp.]|jgi:hypothetical protein|nr:MAG: hypothetical protein DI546_20575 [Rhizobium sp.]RSV29426.1 hypothetical protein CA237_09140 [Sphingomonas sp. ABOLH]
MVGRSWKTDTKELRPDIDKDLALDFLFGPLYARMIIRGAKFTKADLQRLVGALDAAIRSC